LQGIDEPVQNVYFPIFLNEEAFFSKRGGQRQIRLIKNEDYRHAILESQPFYRANADGTDPLDDPLWILHELRNIDTHRKLHRIRLDYQFPRAPLGAFKDLGDGLIEIGLRTSDEHKQRLNWDGDPFELNTELKGNFPARVIFFEPRYPALHGKEVIPTLELVQRGVAAVFRRVTPFFKEGFR
jgi:hypothetical protein